MRYRFISLALSLGVCLMITACSSGLYVKMDSSAPPQSPVFIGMKRLDAERHLGEPLYIDRLSDDKYRGIYEYETVFGAMDMLAFDLMDFTTLGLGNLIVTPLDRIKGSRHLLEVVYHMDENHVTKDRIVDIKEQVEVSLEEE